MSPKTSERTDRSRPYFGADRSLHPLIYQTAMFFFTAVSTPLRGTTEDEKHAIPVEPRGESAFAYLFNKGWRGGTEARLARCMRKSGW